MGERVESGLMVIEIMGNDVHYTFKPTGKAYEIRRVSARDLSMLRLAGRDPAFKASKTVQVLTHLYKDSHYFADTGEPAPPARGELWKIKQDTPYEREDS